MSPQRLSIACPLKEWCSPAESCVDEAVVILPGCDRRKDTWYTGALTSIAKLANVKAAVAPGCAAKHSADVGQCLYANESEFSTAALMICSMA